MRRGWDAPPPTAVSGFVHLETEWDPIWKEGFLQKQLVKDLEMVSF